MAEEFSRAARGAVRGALRRALKQGEDLAELGLGACELADQRCVSGFSTPPSLNRALPFHRNHGHPPIVRT